MKYDLDCAFGGPAEMHGRHEQARRLLRMMGAAAAQRTGARAAIGALRERPQATSAESPASTAGMKKALSPRYR